MMAEPLEILAPNQILENHEQNNVNNNKIKVENYFDFTSNKNNCFKVNFKNCSNYIEITSNSNNKKIYSKFENKYYLNELKKNKFLALCDSIDDIYEQLMIELKKNTHKIIIEDNNRNSLTIIIPVEHIKIKDITFSLKGKIKTEKEQIKDLSEELIIVKDNMKEEIDKIKNDVNLLKEENKQLKEKNVYLENQIKAIFDKLNNINSNKDKIILENKDNNLKNIINNLPYNNDNKYNNIIYYNENFKNTIYQDSDYFEKNTPGAFILCTSIDSLKLIKEEILYRIKKDKVTYYFNLILGEFNKNNFQIFLNENKDFLQFIKNAIIYQSYLDLNIKSLKIVNLYKNKEKIKNFIVQFSSKDIKPYPLIKLISYKEYLDKYKKFHQLISKFYGDLSGETYNNYFDKLKKLIIKENDQNKLSVEGTTRLIEGFSCFDIKKDDKLIVKEWTKNIIGLDLNRWLYNLDMDNFETIAYFTSRFIYSLNCYAFQENCFCLENNKRLYVGHKRTYTNLMLYKKAKGNIIVLSTFFSASEDKNVADKYSGRKSSKGLYETRFLFSTVIIVENHYLQNYIPNGIKIQNLSSIKDDKEILFQPFSFYKVKDVIINIDNYTADIYLETIGKEEILEEQIKKGKEIEYNEKEKLILVKN